jgi:hypothetical protein
MLSSTSSDSDSDGDSARLLEAVDPQFGNRKEQNGSKSKVKETAAASLRRDKAQEQNSYSAPQSSSSNNGIQVTKEFQDFVARKLFDSMGK